MKIMKLILSFILFFLFIGCENIISIKKEKYNFSIVYDYVDPTNREDKYRSKFSNDKLYVFIESEFINDTIKLIVNNKRIFEKIAKTEPSSGLAEVIEIDNINKIQMLNFSINRSPNICFEIIDKNMNFIGVSKKSNNVKFVFYKKAPIYE